MSDEAKGSGGSGDKPKDTRSIIEKLRAQAAAKGEGAPAGGGEASGETAASGAPAGAAEGSTPQPPSKPMSKLEMARAAAAKSAQAPAEPKAGAAAPQKPAGKLAAARAAAQASPAAVAKAKPTRPAAKPVKPKAEQPAGSGSRRFFLLTWIGVAWASFTAGCSAAVLAGVRFLYPNVLQEPPSVFKIGAADQFGEGEVSERWKNEYGVWVVRNDNSLYCIRTVCTHLGCTPNWLEGEQKFKCPCHGSGFRKTGINFEGPAPRPLERHPIMIADDGQVQIDKSSKLQQELGQWTEENRAFIRLS